jgi:predicted RNA binding protein YcfA (HicA-like mRNA interferase family)
VKFPRDLSGSDLVRLLSQFGYVATRQTGSHIRLRSTHTGAEHLITIPNHSPVKIGTANAILSEVAAYLQINKQELVEKLVK